MANEQPNAGPGFVFNMGGGPGVRVHQFGGGRPRRRPRGEDEPPQSASSILTSLLPLILLFIFPLLSSLFSSSTPAGPTMRFDAAAPPHTQKIVSGYHKIPYWVNPAEIRDYTKAQRKTLDNQAEKRYLHHLNVACDEEHRERERLMQEAQGWFFVDEAQMERARRMELKSCKRLSEMTRATNSWY
jgi:DnaJ family protein B protein 12